MSLLTVLLLVIPFTSGAPPPSGFWKPNTGNCVMDGVYYNQGENWTLPEEPCTTYKCFHNGFYKPITTGCQFRGECKAVGNNWKEGCQTYTCGEDGFYKLKEAGCMNKNGSCVKVGEVIKQGCNILECQINGSCIGFQTIPAGCEVEGTCRAIGSFWHDGCTIYKCNRENGNAVQKTLEYEVMQWPDGDYGLLGPTAGCPDDVAHSWSSGSRLHYGAGSNEFSVPYDLAGDHGPDFIEHTFCVHSPVRASSRIPDYKTYWEPGKYCILRSKGKCPKGFRSGYVQMDDDDGKVHDARNKGTLPDGLFGPDTGLHFCCRNDGQVENEIVLPKERAFVLFMFMRENSCQAVRGMSHSVQHFKFSDSLPGKRIKSNFIPKVTADAVGTTLHLCHYKPKECGCTDKDGTYYTVNMEHTSNCVTRKCVERNIFKVLEVISGGCSVGGLCKEEGSVWSESYGESCTKHTCRREVVDGEIQFIVTNDSKGCQDGDICQDLGYIKKKDCYTSKCILDDKSHSTKFKVQTAECPWLKSCKPGNMTWTHQCMRYRCDIERAGDNYQRRVTPIDFGCSDSGQCYAVGETTVGKCYSATCRLTANKSAVYMDVNKGELGACDWHGECKRPNEVWADGCLHYKCVTSKNTTQIKWEVQTDFVGCEDFKGGCVHVGAHIIDQCINYTCTRTGDQVGLKATTTGCSYNNGCKAENELWTDDNCIEYSCLRQEIGPASFMQVKVMSYGCRWETSCKKANTTWEDGCRTRKCVVHRKGTYLEKSMAPIKAGCDDGGLCRPDGYKKMTNSCQEFECSFTMGRTDAFFKYNGAACKSEGVCHPVGTDWTEIKTKFCIKYTCSKRSTFYYNEEVERMCKDVYGRCHPVGSKGFDAIIKGVRRTNCTCEQKGFDTGIQVRCLN